MTRVLVAGLCPFPWEDAGRNYGPGVRTWQFAWSLARAGHAVRLLAQPIPGAYAIPPAREEERDGVRILRVLPTEIEDPAFVRREVVAWDAEAVVGATIYGAVALARCDLELPFWADQFGHVMAEAQAKAAIEGANWPLAYFWRMARAVDLGADHFSVVSERQRYALIGELGALGRLNAETCGYEFASVIPCAAAPELPTPPAGRLLRGRRIPEDAFVVLWSGGFNVWSDVETLFAGVDRAMSENDRVHFVSTGGGIVGQDEETYERFRCLVAGSAHASRYLLEGWVSQSLVPAYTAEADLGVVTDRPMYEGLLGSKNRVLQWMNAGLAVAYNRWGDVGDLVATPGLGLSFEVGDSEGLCSRIVWAAQHPSELAEIVRRAEEEVAARYTFEATARSLVEWSADPRPAPDREWRGRIRSPDDFGEPRQVLVSAVKRVPFLARLPAARWAWRWMTRS